MKPVLIVEGKQFDAASIDWHEGKPTKVGVFEGNTYVIYHDTTANEYIEAPLKIDLSECLKWQGQYDEIYQTLDKAIEDNQKEIQDLATEIADSVLPFAFPSKVKKREELKQHTFGLMDAQEIVHALMEEDVELTGGEEVE